MKDIPVYDPGAVPIPEDVMLAAQEGCLSFFIGNGLSRLFGVPSWNELTDRMLDQLASSGVINHSDATLLKTQPLKAKFSIADHYFKKNNRNDNKDSKEGITYKEMLYKTVISDKMSVYRTLAKCGIKFITTNYDTLLDEALIDRFKSKNDLIGTTSDKEATTSDSIEDNNGSGKEFLIFSHPNELKKSAYVEQNVLLHLHGSVASSKSETNIIASTADYLNLYANNELMENVRDLIKDQALVFLGYGLDELEVLELVLRSTTDIADVTARATRPFFLLLPILSHEKPVLKHLSIYWEEQLGIKILAYSIDVKGYDALEEVVESWSAVLAEKSKAPSRVKHVNLIDDLMCRFDGASE